MSQRPGGVLPSISASNAKLEQATCFTISPKVRTSAGPYSGCSPLNIPSAGRKPYLSAGMASAAGGSGEDTAEIQSLAYFVCRLFLLKKKKKKKTSTLCL